MKKAIYGFFVGIFFAFSANVIAGNITANGMYQGDLFTYLSNVLSLGNEQKTDYNALFASYTSNMNSFNNFTSFAELENFSFNAGSATAVTSSDLSLTGL
jgi:hypothetical protein